jgi:hypothetical protein
VNEVPGAALAEGRRPGAELLGSAWVRPQSPSPSNAGVLPYRFCICSIVVHHHRVKK